MEISCAQLLALKQSRDFYKPHVLILIGPAKNVNYNPLGMLQKKLSTGGLTFSIILVCLIEQTIKSYSRCVCIKAVSVVRNEASGNWEIRLILPKVKIRFHQNLIRK